MINISKAATDNKNYEGMKIVLHETSYNFYSNHLSVFLLVFAVPHLKVEMRQWASFTDVSVYGSLSKSVRQSYIFHKVPNRKCQEEDTKNYYIHLYLIEFSWLFWSSKCKQRTFLLIDELGSFAKLANKFPGWSKLISAIRARDIDTWFVRSSVTCSSRFHPSREEETRYPRIGFLRQRVPISKTSTGISD